MFFCTAIFAFTKDHLAENGAVYLETHMSLANEVAALFNDEKFALVEIKKDLQGKERMVKGVKM